MKITDIFVRRPVLAISINIIVLLAGFKSISFLPTRQYPKSDLSVVTVNTTYVGADADLVRGYITTPLEKAIASADGIDYLESSSANSISTIKANLLLNYPVSEALTQIQSKVLEVRQDLPPEAELPIINVESADNQFASMYMSFSSDVLDPNQVTDYLVRVVQPKLSSLQGVQKADALGARTFAMRIWLKPEVLSSANLSVEEIRQALIRNNYLSAVGQAKGSMVVTPLATNTDLRSKEEFQNLIIREDGENVMRLRDVAEVELGAEKYDNDTLFGGKPAIFMGIWVLPNANSLEVIKRVREAIPEIQANAPQGLSIEIPYDATKYIDDALHEVIRTLTETVFIVILVIFVFMGSFRSVLVPVIAIPLSLIGTVSLMVMFGFTINLLTLLAIVLAVGLVVDDAIVMLENIERNIKEGLSPIDAALKGARELVGPIISMTITLAAVYAPIGIQGGLTGTLFREFAFTLAGAVIISGFVALTLSPVMSSLLLHSGEKPTKLQNAVNNFMDKLSLNYGNLLRTSIKNSNFILGGTLLLMLMMPLFYMFSAKELAPREDQGVVFGIVQGSPNATIEQTRPYTKKMQEAYRSIPEYKTSFQSIESNGGFSGAVLKPWSERSRTAQEISMDLDQRVSDIPGVRIIMTTPPPLPGGRNFPVEMVVSSTDSAEKMLPLSFELIEAAFASGMFMFADSDLKFDFPRSVIEFDRDAVSKIGVNLQSVGSEISTMLGGNYINRFSMDGRSYKVIPQVERSKRLTAEDILSLPVMTLGGQSIPLSAIAKLKKDVQPRSLNKFQQLNSFTIMGLPRPGASIDDALTALEKKAKEILPFGYQIDYPGESRQLRKEGSSLVQTMFLSVLFIYLVLAAQFESFRDPFIILLGSVPLALAAALLFPFLGFTTMNIYSQVGLVTLVGLVSKNGILIVEFANHLKEEGKSKIEAVIEASVLRLRPILMTSIATVVGHFPLILASGAGAAARNSIGIVLVSGMFMGTIFTLFIVPLIYALVSKGSKASKVEQPINHFRPENKILSRQGL
jgi:multidrug efflux pump